MRVLIVHNHYGDHAIGGEGLVVQAEAALLRSYGHDVQVYERSNSEILRRGLFGQIKSLGGIGWSGEGYAAVSDEIQAFRPDLMHVHNYKYLLSPSVFAAAQHHGVATVLSLHNYRLICPAGQFMRSRVPCEDCLDGFPYRMLYRRCSGWNVVKSLCQLHLHLSTKRRGLLTPWVDAYISLTEFGRSRFISAGIPECRIITKSHFVEDPGFQPSGDTCHGSAIYVGRLSREKGVDALIDAWRDIQYPLKVIGDGPLMSSLRRIAPRHVRLLGAMSRPDTIEELRESDFLIFPSLVYESFGLVLLEAMALGKPIIATDLGPRREIVADGGTGFLYCPSDRHGLQNKSRALIKHSDLRLRMGLEARSRYLAYYTPERNLPQLLNVYKYAQSRHCSMPALHIKR